MPSSSSGNAGLGSQHVLVMRPPPTLLLVRCQDQEALQLLHFWACGRRSGWQPAGAAQGGLQTAAAGVLSMWVASRQDMHAIWADGSPAEAHKLEFT